MLSCNIEHLLEMIKHRPGVKLPLQGCQQLVPDMSKKTCQHVTSANAKKREKTGKQRKKTGKPTGKP